MVLPFEYTEKIQIVSRKHFLFVELVGKNIFGEPLSEAINTYIIFYFHCFK